MFRYLLSDNDINLGDDYGLNASDVLFVEEIISGTKESLRRGRTRNKFFLYGAFLPSYMRSLYFFLYACIRCVSG